MKFISKNSTYRLILRAGQPAELATGRLPVPTIFVRFEEGVAEVKDEEHIKMVLAHKDYGVDFFAYESTDLKTQKLIADRVSAEPEHDITDIQFGHVGRKTSANKFNMTPEIKAMLLDNSMAMAKSIALEMVKEQMKPIQDLLKSLADKQEKEGGKSKNKTAKPAEADSAPKITGDELALTGTSTSETKTE